MATAAPKFKVGQRVGMLSWHMDGTAWRQPAKVARTMPYMLPMPPGYVPVRFESDGARLLVHVSCLEAA